MFFPKRMLGIDIGTATVKLVEISRWGESRTLQNYGEVKSNVIYKEPLANQKNIDVPSGDLVSQSIKGILEEAKIKTKEAIFSLPDFSTFCTLFDIPAMTAQEIPGAIRYNASQYITLPIGEVTLDWQIIPSSLGDHGPRKIFLIAVPNQVIQEYQAIAKNAGLELYALEAEVLGIARVLARNNKKIVCVMDIGVQSSTINIIDKGFLKRSYSFNFNSNQLARAVSSALNIDYNQAEAIKNKEGMTSKRQGVAEALSPLIDQLVLEVKNISAEFLLQEQKQVDEIFLVGGTANLPGLKEYFAENLKKELSIPNCFSGLLYPSILGQTLKEMSPRFSAATGVALGGLED